MKNIQLIPFLFLVILSACSSNYSLDDFSNHIIKFEKKQIESDSLNYSLTVPRNWKLNEVVYNKEIKIERFRDSLDINNQYLVLSVSKHKGIANELDTEVNNIKYSEDLPEGFERISLRRSNFLPYDSYFSHIKSTVDDESGLEITGFIVKGKEDSTFYVLMASAPKEKAFRDNMGMLVQCMKDFKIK